MSHESPHEGYLKSYIPGRYNKLDNLTKLRRAFDEKEIQIHKLNGNIMTFKTQKQNIELENYKLDDEYLEVKQQLKTIQDQIDELMYHEQQSLKDIDLKYEITIKELDLEFESNLQREKELITNQIETIINDVQKLNIQLRDTLMKQCDDFQSQIQQQEQELNQQRIMIQQDSDKRLVSLESNLDNSIIKVQKDLSMKNDEILAQKQLIDDANKKLLVTKNSCLKSELDSVNEIYKDNETEINSLQSRINNLQAQITQSENNAITKTKQSESLNFSIERKSNSLQDLEEQRRYLHNKVQQLKGNIRVYCRIRPPSPNSNELISLDYPDTEEVNQSVVISKDDAMYNFQFDKIFTPVNTNHEIFEELSQLVQSSLDGYNVCVFAYGQTGSGKTYTMSHPQHGMIPLTINKIFNDIEDLRQTGWEYLIEGQFLEIYNENIVDLLGSVNIGSSGKYEIKHDDVNNTTTISNLNSIKLDDAQHALLLFTKSSTNRSTASTKSNERSSRSHSIFKLNIKGINKNGQKCEGCLNLIDLAGSERLNNSQVNGDRLKETRHINKSLSSLGDVIYSLSQNSSHVPYRNSKLTYLLKHSLGGDSKTLMFVNISPSLANFGESLNSFRFATKVSNIKMRK